MENDQHFDKLYEIVFKPPNDTYTVAMTVPSVQPPRPSLWMSLFYLYFLLWRRAKKTSTIPFQSLKDMTIGMSIECGTTAKQSYSTKWFGI